MIRCGQDIICRSEISAVDSFYNQSIRKYAAKILSRRRQSNVSRGENDLNRIESWAAFPWFGGRLVQAGQKRRSSLDLSPLLKSSNRKIAESNRCRQQFALAAFCSVNFGLYSRRLICHSIHKSWIGGHGVWGGGKS
jgi:hypothetical protein